MFPDIIVHIATAMMCLVVNGAEVCHPVLVGPETPRGVFQVQHYSIPDPGYGGDLLVFKEDLNALYAIHRVLNIPGQQRIERIASPVIEHRTMVTAGCINVTPAVFSQLIECCYKSKVIIK